jgi:hypothetical protein
MNITNAVAAIPPDVAVWSTDYANIALFMAQLFLGLAFAVAVVETGLALWAKVLAARRGPVIVENATTETVVPAVDPVKLLEALKALLETLKGLPAWIAIFLAGLALLWIAGQKPEICTRAGASHSEQNRGALNPDRQNGQAGNTQAPIETNAAQ